MFIPNRLTNGCGYRLHFAAVFRELSGAVLKKKTTEHGDLSAPTVLFTGSFSKGSRELEWLKDLPAWKRMMFLCRTSRTRRTSSQRYRRAGRLGPASGFRDRRGRPPVSSFGVRLRRRLNGVHFRVSAAEYSPAFVGGRYRRTAR